MIALPGVWWFIATGIFRRRLCCLWYAGWFRIRKLCRWCWRKCGARRGLCSVTMPPMLPAVCRPAGTVLGCTDDTFLLFCRDFRPASGSLRAFYPYPLEIRLNHLCADGSLQPLSSAGSGWCAGASLPAGPGQSGVCGTGNPLPLVLSHTDRLVAPSLPGVAA